MKRATKSKKNLNLVAMFVCSLNYSLSLGLTGITKDIIYFVAASKCEKN